MTTTLSEDGEHYLYGCDRICPDCAHTCRLHDRTGTDSGCTANDLPGRCACTGDGQHAPEYTDVQAYYRKQIAWSAKTFGPGKRTLGILEHITKELAEVKAKPDDLSEWIDVVILAMDGYWRHGGTADSFMRDLEAKQRKNFSRVWPAPGPEDKAMEHVRDTDGLVHLSQHNALYRRATQG